MAKLMKRTAWQQWFDGLKPGDRVLSIQPWQDRESIATVGRVHTYRDLNGTRRISDVKIFRYRNKIGNRVSECIRHPWGSCYFHVVPLGHKMVYWPSYGYVIKQK